MDKDVKIYPITNSLVDLFFGEGWKDWTRVTLKREKGKVVDLLVVGGKQRSPKQLLQIFTNA